MGGISTVVNSLTSGATYARQWLLDALSGDYHRPTGVEVTTRSVLGYPPVWYAVNKISSHVARLPLELHRRLANGGSEMAIANSVYSLIRHRPNQWQTAFQFRHNLMVHALLTGNGRAAIYRNSAKEPTELVPMPPEHTVTCMEDGNKIHVYWSQDHESRICQLWEPDVPRGQSRSGYVGYKFDDADVLHIPGLSWDGINGLSIIEVAKEAMGIGVAAQRAVATSFKNGSRPSLVITVPQGKLTTKEEADEFLKKWNEYHQTPDNWSKTGLLREGMQISTLQVSPSDAQWLEQRKFQDVCMALLFGIEHIPGDDKSVSYNSLEQKNQAYLSNCLDPWLERWEQECRTKLLGRNSQSTHFFRFDVSELLRPNATARAAYYRNMVMIRAMNPNEVRAKEGMNPYQGGDRFENPAITPGADTKDNDGDGEIQEEQSEDSNATVAAVADRMRHLLSVAANQAKAATGHSEKFLDYIDRQYGYSEKGEWHAGKWQKTLWNAIRNCGGDPEIAKPLCEKLKNQLLEVAGSVNEKELLPAVREVVDSWPEMATEIAKEIVAAHGTV